VEVRYGCDSDIRRLPDIIATNTRSTDITSKAGLFSAVVTAFIIESYKTLKQDSGDITVALLAQISNQLANGTNAVIPSPTPNKAQFEPPASALRVNVLWFLSLTFSLACALVATLVQQWSRNYLDASHRRPRLYKRARIRSYLHEGLEKFGMITVVNTIPTLIHISLFLFFGGLVEFLRPINRAISYLALGILIVCGSLYVGTAVISAVSHNCPYRIPISGIFWRTLNLSRWVYRRFDPPTRLQDGLPRIPEKLPRNMAEEAELQSMKEHCHRDLTAIQWTLESLTDNTELEPFVEGIQGFTVSEDILQTDAATILIEIYNDREFDLGSRIDRLLGTCDQILEPSLRQKRRVACLSAIWTFTSLSVTHKNLHIFPDYGLILRDERQPVWLRSPTIEAHWARCVGTLLSCILLAEDHQPQINASNARWSGLLAFLSNIPPLNSLSLQLRADVYRLNLSEYRILALIGFLFATVESPFDPIALSQHPHINSDPFFRPLLNVVTHQLTMASVRPQIQSALAGAVSRTLKHSYAWHPYHHFFDALDPLIDGLDDPAAIQATVDALEDYKLTNQWIPPRIMMLKAKLRPGTGVGQPQKFANENEGRQHENREPLKLEHAVEQLVKRIEGHGDLDGGRPGGEDGGSIENSGMGEERDEDGAEMTGSNGR